MLFLKVGDDRVDRFLLGMMVVGRVCDASNKATTHSLPVYLPTPAVTSCPSGKPRWKTELPLTLESPNTSGLLNTGMYAVPYAPAGMPKCNGYTNGDRPYEWADAPAAGCTTVLNLKTISHTTEVPLFTEGGKKDRAGEAIAFYNWSGSTLLHFRHAGRLASVWVDGHADTRSLQEFRSGFTMIGTSSYVLYGTGELNF